MSIIRSLPKKKQELRIPYRYSPRFFRKYEEFMDNYENIKVDYEKWENGINPYTNRKIKINGRVHKKIKDNFLFPYINTIGRTKYILFTKIDNINKEQYINETKEMKKKIKRKNKKIKKYNKKIDKIISEINKLDDWDSFVIFENKKYGYYSKVKDDIHIENNCKGKMEFIKTETELHINDRPFCNYSDGERTYNYYKCKKCKYEHRICVNHIPKGGYESKMGFWWK